MGWKIGRWLLAAVALTGAVVLLETVVYGLIGVVLLGTLVSMSNE